MLGLEDSLAGVTDYCVHPAHVVGRKQRVGGTKTPRIHQIIELCPDLVIVNTDENRRQSFDQLKAAGLNLLVTQTDSLDEVESTWIQIGEATGTEASARRHCERIVAARAYNRTALQGIGLIPALIPVWRDPWMASGSGTYMESLLSECGFRNILSRTDKKWIRISFQPSREAEAHAFREHPQVVLLPSEPYHFRDIDRNELVEAGIPIESVRLVDGVLLSWWLSRTVEALEHFRLFRLTLNPLPCKAR